MGQDVVVLLRPVEELQLKQQYDHKEREAQSALESLPISPDDGEHADIYKLRIRVRGNLEWAPPRPQIIFNIHPAPK
jgi:hypothetical protein